MWWVVLFPSLGTLGLTVARAAVAFEARRRGASGLEVGLLTTLFQLGRGLLAPLGGWISDRLGRRKPILLAGLVVLLAATTAAGFVPGVLGLLGVRLAQGAGAGLLWPTMQATVAEAFANPAWALSLYFFSGSTAMALSFGIYSLWFAENFREAIGTSVLLLGVTLLIVLFWRPQRVALQGPRPRLLGGVPFLILSAILAGGTIGLSSDLLLIYLAQDKLLGERGATALLFAAQLLGHLFMLVLAPLAGRGYARAVLAFCFAAIGAGALGVAHTRGFALLISVILLRAGAFTFTPVSRYLARTFSERNVGATIGFLNLTSNLGGASFPIVGGFLYNLLEQGIASANPWLWLGVLALVWTAAILAARG